MSWWRNGAPRRRRDRKIRAELPPFRVQSTRFRSPPTLYRALGLSAGRMMTIDEIRDNFALLDDWDDRYRYVIELGRTLKPMPEAEHSAQNKVQGCASQGWLAKQLDRGGGHEPVLNYLGDSDAHIVRGLIAILLTLVSARTPREILATDALCAFYRVGVLG